MTIAFEPNCVETNAVECDGVLLSNVFIYPNLYRSEKFFLNLTLIDHGLLTYEGPIIFYVPTDPPGFTVPAAQGSFMVPASRGQS